MKPPEEVLRDLVRQWMEKAEADYETAQLLLQAPGGRPDIVAFHCQQAAEKYLKALLVSERIEFPKTHSIRQLLSLLATDDQEMASRLHDAAALTPYGVEVRYPGESPQVTPAEANSLFAITCLVREVVRSRLP